MTPPLLSHFYYYQFLVKVNKLLSASILLMKLLDLLK